MGIKGGKGGDFNLFQALRGCAWKSVVAQKCERYQYTTSFFAIRNSTNQVTLTQMANFINGQLQSISRQIESGDTKNNSLGGANVGAE